MYSIEAVVTDEMGLHARPANKFVKKASSFSSDIKVKKVGSEASYNAKSITAVLRMSAVQNTKLIIMAEGDDEVQACEALKMLVENNYQD